jgi:hypothetical protein
MATRDRLVFQVERAGAAAPGQIPWSLSLVHRPLRKVVPVRLQVQHAEGLLVLGQILSQHVPQRLGLLRAQKDRPGDCGW